MFNKRNNIRKTKQEENAKIVVSEENVWVTAM